MNKPIDIFENLAVKFSTEPMIGPEEGEELLLEFLRHCFTEEEAKIAIELPFFYKPVSFEKLMKKQSTDPKKVKSILDDMVEKGLIRGRGKGYALLPILPGMYENVLIEGKESPWHVEFARLANALYETGYVRRYLEHPTQVVRNIPIDTSFSLESKTVNPDSVEEMIKAHDTMAVINNCQCRQAKYLLGDECTRADRFDGCIAFGDFARLYVERGGAREVDKDSMRSIVKDRWNNNLVFFAGNVSASSTNQICTCCDCCCHMLGQIINVDPNLIVSPPMYKAFVDEDKCTQCGKCVAVCNLMAHCMINRKHSFDGTRCVGCGLCIGVCPSVAIEMVENKNFTKPAKSFKRLGLRLAPSKIKAMVKSKIKGS